MELRNMNNDVLDDQINGDGSLKDSESFKKHYATVLVQLKEAGGQACGFREFLYHTCTLLSESVIFLFK